MKPGSKVEFLRAFHLTGIGLDALQPRTPSLIKAEPLPEGGPTLKERYSAALKEQRGKARERFLANVAYCRDRMQELLTLDDQRDPHVSAAPKTIEASMGAAGAFFDSGALAVALQTAPSPVERMSASRRKRCERTLNTLNEALRDAATQPQFWEFPAADPGAIAFCETQLDWHVGTLRAMRVARLEMHASYDEAIHDEAVARFHWESADAEELAAMPVVLVVDTAENLAEKSLTTLGKLLRSGLPMQILLSCRQFYTGDLAFLAVSQREAFVMQSSVACPEHLTVSLMDMAHTLRPAVAIVATADPAIFHQSRTFPLYVYNPENGEHWHERFRLYQDPAANPEWNAVHAAAAGIASDSLRHFRVLAKEDWSDEQVELASYLALYKTQPPLAVPFIWVEDADGNKQRAIVTRELVQIARDRIRAWQLLVDLADAGKPAPPVVDTAKLQQDSAKETMLRVVSWLTGNGFGAASAAAPPTAAPAVRTEVVAAQAGKPLDAAPAPASASEIVETVDPYIESSMCTSCNDCMKINSRMFQYNGDRQAYIPDPSLGTFAELVKAAEGCPAKCIHPGTPRAVDKTATPQLRARAAKFN